MPGSSLSQRGQLAQNTALRVDFEVFFEAMENQYDPENNPDGAIALNIAENKLSWFMLQQKIQELSCTQTLPDWVASYTSALGAPEFREVLAAYMARFLTKCPINPDHLGLSAGATATIEVTSWILGERGDVAVFPAPCYPVYKQDIGNKAGLERYDLITHYDLKEISQEPALQIHYLEKAWQDIDSQGKRMRMLVLTTPDNPTGGLFSEEKLAAIAEWCIEREVHLIVNEIYGLSLIHTDHPSIAEDYTRSIEFSSFANIMQVHNSEYLHLLYALSKDWGASGFRVGVVYSLNEAFLAAFNNLNPPHMVSNFTQWIFQQVFSDVDFVEKYIAHNQKVMTESYALVIEYLKKWKVPYVPARGSLFVWLDLSEFLSEQSQEAENQLWMDIYEKTKVLLTPGEGFGHAKKGQYRLVYSCVGKEELEVAMDRMEKWLTISRSTSN